MKKTLIMNSLMSQSRRVMDKTEFLAAIKLVKDIKADGDIIKHG